MRRCRGEIINWIKCIAHVPRRNYTIEKYVLRRCCGEIIQLKKMYCASPRRDYTIEKINCAGAAAILHNWNKLIAQVPRRDYTYGINVLRRCRGEIILLKKNDCAGAATRLHNWKKLIAQVPRQEYIIELRRCRGEMYDRDIQLLQFCAATLPPDEFLVHCLNKFGLVAWAAKVR